MSTVLLVLLVILIANILLVSFLIVHYVREIRDARVEHAKCIAHIAHYVGDAFAESVLKAAADDYDSPSGKRTLSALSRERQTNEERSLPAVWLIDRAQSLQWSGEPFEERTLSGERA